VTVVESARPGAAWSASLRRAPEADLAAWLSLALEMCDEADRIALRWYRREVPTSRKPDRTFVTEADRAIERLVRDRIRAIYPDHGFVGEEYGDEDGAAGVRWYIDPIDGTHNFIRGVPLFGTLLAVEVDGEMQVGVMSAPAMGERWYAARGRGAWAVARDGLRRRVLVSSVDALGEAQLIYGSRRENVASGLMPGFDAVIDACWRDRGFGDFWGYALVAEGAAEAMIETGMRSWDVAAPMIIIEEAGGRVTDMSGARDVNAASFVGSNGLLHEELLRGLATPG
jgi:histidinol-phosphatase